MHAPKIRTFIPLFLLLLGIFLIVWWAETRREDDVARLLRLKPRLSADFIRHIAYDDNGALTAYAREIGPVPFRQTNYILFTDHPADTEEAYLEYKDLVLPFSERIAVTLRDVFGFEEAYRNYVGYRNKPVESAITSLHINRRQGRIIQDTTLPIEVRIDSLYALLEIVREQGLDKHLCNIHGALHGLLYRSKREVEARPHLNLALFHAKQVGRVNLVCQILGTKGYLHSLAGEPDSMAICWEELRSLALERHLPEQAGRYYMFYSGLFSDQGRMALAGDYRRRAVEACRRLKGRHKEFRFLADNMSFHADMGCWELVEQELMRVPVLLEMMEEFEVPGEYELFEIECAIIEGRLLMARGEVERADGIFSRLSAMEPGPDIHMTLRKARTFCYWAEGLIDNGFPERAVPVLAGGIEVAKDPVIPNMLPPMEILRAKVALARGEVEEAENALGRFRAAAERSPDAHRAEWIEHDALWVDVHRKRNDWGASRRGLIVALERLLRYAGEIDGSAQGRLQMRAFRELRHALHAYVESDADLGYRAELEWRSLMTLIGRETPRARSEWTARARETCLGHLAKILEEADSRRGRPADSELRRLHVDPLDFHGTTAALSACGGRHLVYFVRNHGIDRWNASAAGVTRDRIGGSSGGVKRSVAQTLSHFFTCPAGEDDSIDGELSGELGTLASTLLPEDLFDTKEEEPTGPLFISADDYLQPLPFETLNLSRSGTYLPLLSRYDVAYIHGAGGSEQPEVSDERGSGADEKAAEDRGLIVADPLLPRETLRRYPGLADLAEGRFEAEIASMVFPKAEVLSGRNATKSKLLDRWEDRPFLYIASHFVRDPDAPYITYLPLSVSIDSMRTDQSLIDALDIRAADFARCDLVVLSGCASGAPYVASTASAPTLADAFLDSRARAVVQTMWMVQDEEARLLMEMFLREWGGEGRSPVEALSSARRVYLRGPNGIRHPSVWGAYTIKTTSIETDIAMVTH